MPRRLKQSWVDEYQNYIKNFSESPANFHFWSAATIIAAALRRNVFVNRGTYNLRPNMFTILVARPGIGKGAALTPAIEILKEANAANVLSDRLTMEFVLEKLSLGFPNPKLMLRPNALGGANDATALMFSPELSIFITASHATLPILADLWDSRDGAWKYGTRGKGEFTIKDGCLSFLAGSSPKWLIDSIPDSAVGGGFTRRVNFVFAEKRDHFIPFPPSKNGNLARTNLIEDLKDISNLSGEYTFADKQTELVYKTFHESSDSDEFESEETANYVSTQATHALKLAMVLVAAESDNLVITKPIIERAIAEVKKCGENLKYVFRAAGTSDMVEASDRVLRFLELRGTASRSEILKACWRHVDSDKLDVVLRTFVGAQMIGESNVGHKIMYSDLGKRGNFNASVATP